MKNRIAMLILAVALTAGMLAGCGARQKQGDAESGYHKITAEQAKERMDSGDEIVVVDVRTEEEYNEKHIPGAVLIPNETIGEEKPEQLPDTEQ